MKILIEYMDENKQWRFW